MWKICFEELRALTNTKQLSLCGLNVNPMELNDIYEHVWNVGVLLQTPDCLSIMEPGYRLWPKVAPNRLHPFPKPTADEINPSTGAVGGGRQHRIL